MNTDQKESPPAHTAEACSPMTADEIIDETLEYYTGHPERFATSLTGACWYLTGDGRMCAFGRCLDTKHPNYPEVSGSPLGLVHIPQRFGNIDDLLKPQYRGMSMDFWDDLQELHDQWARRGLESDNAWDGQAQLTQKGQEMVKSMRQKYAGSSHT